MDYKNGKIYTLRSHQTDLIYIGSTCSPLSKRFSQHRCNYKRFLEGKHHFVSSNEIIKFEDAYIELLEEYPCENKLQLSKREGELIRKMNCVNKRIENRTHEEWFKEYYNKNKDKLFEIIDCECGGYYKYKHKSTHFKTEKHQEYLTRVKLY